MVDYRWARPLVFVYFHRWPVINVSQSCAMYVSFWQNIEVILQSLNLVNIEPSVFYELEPSDLHLA